MAVMAIDEAGWADSFGRPLESLSGGVPQPGPRFTTGQD